MPVKLRAALAAAGALTVLALAPAAQANKVNITIWGAGTVTEDTAAGLANCTSPPTTPNNTFGARCVVDGYGWGWWIKLRGTPAPGYGDTSWFGIRDPEPVWCDGTNSQTGALWYGDTCSFTSWFGDLGVRVYFIDHEPPATMLGSHPPTRTNSHVAAFSLTSSQAGSTFQCRLDTTSWSPCAASTQYGWVAEGQHTFQARAVDPSGNADETPVSWTWTVDTTPPDTWVVAGPPATTEDRSADFAFGSSEAGSSFFCSLDGAAFYDPCGVDHLVLAGLGAHVLRVLSQDEAGNRDATPAEWRWTVVDGDSTPPTAKLGKLPAVSVKGASIKVTWSGTDAGSGIQSFDVRYRRATLSQGFGESVPWLSTPLLTGTVLGNPGETFCFSVRAVDAAGNVGAWSAERCTAIPVDDRALLPVAGSWTPLTGSAYYQRTASRSAAAGSGLMLTEVRAKRISLVASTCPTCGTVRLLWNGAEILRRSLATTTAKNKVVVAAPAFAAPQSGNLIIESIGTATVDVDGVALSAS